MLELVYLPKALFQLLEIKFHEDTSGYRMIKSSEQAGNFLQNGLRTDMKEWSLMDSLAPGERIILSLSAKVVRSTTESTGELLAGDKRFYFYSASTRSTQVFIIFFFFVCSVLFFLVILST